MKASPTVVRQFADRPSATMSLDMCALSGFYLQPPAALPEPVMTSTNYALEVVNYRSRVVTSQYTA